MVTKYRKLYSIAAALICLMILTCGCAGKGSGNNRMRQTESDESGYNESGSGGNGDEGSGPGDGREEPEVKKDGSPVQGPDLPPEGVRYDEWKGFKYSIDTEFPVRTYWSFMMASGGPLPEQGLVQDPEHIEDAVLRITDAKSEPVGGEMKLRSSGYVDITVELEWTGTMNGYEDFGKLDNKYLDWGVHWEENSAYPCDAYTGTSLMNFRDADEDKADEDISPGQAVISSMVESVITWEERTYRLFAKADVRNASGGDWTSRYANDRFIFSCPGRVETTLTFRVPADYDGLVLAIDKDITDEKADNIDNSGNALPVIDLYADILTTSKGVKQTADDFYFVRVSDLLKKFEEK